MPLGRRDAHHCAAASSELPAGAFYLYRAFYIIGDAGPISHTAARRGQADISRPTGILNIYPAAFLFIGFTRNRDAALH